MYTNYLEFSAALIINSHFELKNLVNTTIQ